MRKTELERVRLFRDTIENRFHLFDANIPTCLNPAAIYSPPSLAILRSQFKVKTCSFRHDESTQVVNIWCLVMETAETKLVDELKSSQYEETVRPVEFSEGNPIQQGELVLFQ